MEKPNTNQALPVKKRPEYEDEFEYEYDWGTIARFEFPCRMSDADFL
jgi:hypothetical protein